MCVTLWRGVGQDTQVRLSPLASHSFPSLGNWPFSLPHVLKVEREQKTSSPALIFHYLEQLHLPISSHLKQIPSQPLVLTFQRNLTCSQPMPSPWPPWSCPLLLLAFAQCTQFFHSCPGQSYQPLCPLLLPSTLPPSFLLLNSRPIPSLHLLTNPWSNSFQISLSSSNSWPCHLHICSHKVMLQNVL